MKLATCSLDGKHEGVALAYVEWGDPSGARVVFCVHGLTRNSRDFDFLAGALSAKGVRVIAVDIVGRGLSSWLQDPQQYSLDTYVAQLHRFLELINVHKLDWIGTSMGGLIGMLMAATYPTLIDRLILNDIGPLVPKTALQQIQTYLGVARTFPDLEAVEQHLRFIHAGFGPLTDAQWRHLATHSACFENGNWRLRYDPAIRIPYETLSEHDIDLWAQWDQIQCPTFVLRGTESPLLLPETAEAMQERGPRARVASFSNVGHAPALMADDQITTIQAWLNL